MKHKLESAVFWIVMAVLMLAFVFTVSQARASERHHHHQGDVQTINNINYGKKDKSWQFPVLIIGIAASVCWVYCGDDKKPEPLPNPGPAVKNDITPEARSLSDKNRTIIIEAN